MATFTTTILEFPTSIFTIGLGITLFYWIAVMLGAFDVGHHFDFELDVPVPITLTVTLTCVLGWGAAMAGMAYTPLLPVVVLLLALVVGVVGALILVRPLAPMFAVREGKFNADYVGHTCVISTGHVDNGFGQATVEDGGTVLVISVRSDGHQALARGDKALICDFDVERQAYVVEPEPTVQRSL